MPDVPVRNMTCDLGAGLFLEKKTFFLKLIEGDFVHFLQIFLVIFRAVCEGREKEQRSILKSTGARSYHRRGHVQLGSSQTSAKSNTEEGRIVQRNT